MTGMDRGDSICRAPVAHQKLRGELVEVFNAALDNAGFIGGPMVAAFEHDFAEFCGVSHCVGVSSGTDALRFALDGCGSGRRRLSRHCSEHIHRYRGGDLANRRTAGVRGCRPGYVQHGPAKLEEYIESRCRVDRDAGYLVDRKLGRRVAALVPVHLYGQPADMESILDLRNVITFPSSKMPAEHTERGTPPKTAGPGRGRLGGMACVQLLSGKESWRLWRSRRSNDKRR